MTSHATDQKPGDRMEDGTVYAGNSPDTHRPIYAPPADASLTYTFNDAVEYVRKLNAAKYLGHDDWRVRSLLRFPARGRKQMHIGARHHAHHPAASAQRSSRF